MVDATSELSYINTWLRGQVEMYAKNYQNAINIFKSLDSPNLICDNTLLLVTIAQCYVYTCDTKNAIALLQRAFRIDPNLNTGKDLLAHLLTQSGEKEHLRELEKLVPTDNDTSLWSCEQWVAMGYSMYANKKYEKAAYFGQQAYTMNRKCVEGIFLKAHSFLQLNKLIEARVHFKEVRQIAPCRYVCSYYVRAMLFL